MGLHGCAGLNAQSSRDTSDPVSARLASELLSEPLSELLSESLSEFPLPAANLYSMEDVGRVDRL